MRHERSESAQEQRISQYYEYKSSQYCVIATRRVWGQPIEGGSSAGMPESQ